MLLVVTERHLACKSPASVILKGPNLMHIKLRKRKMKLKLQAVTFHCHALTIISHWIWLLM